VLDFGASAKAHAADRIAHLLAGRLEGGFLVNLGGDIAVSGDPPDGGWRVGVEGDDGGVRQVVAITDQGVATSSTQRRQWTTGNGSAHHIVDPRTGATAPAVWAQVTCIAASALEANTASTAAIVLGEAAPAWLDRNGVAARLDRADGAVVFAAAWPRPDVDDTDGTVAR
jgi:thiamine biosynthesis lipoprotein